MLLLERFQKRNNTALLTRLVKKLPADTNSHGGRRHAGLEVRIGECQAAQDFDRVAQLLLDGEIARAGADADALTAWVVHGEEHAAELEVLHGDDVGVVELPDDGEAGAAVGLCGAEVEGSKAGGGVGGPVVREGVEGVPLLVCGFVVTRGLWRRCG